MARARASAGPALTDFLGEVLRVLDGWRTVDKLLSGRADMALLPALADMKAQLERLVHPGFLSEAGPEQLRRYPTYLRALTLRREALDQGGAAVNRDRQLMDRIAELQESYLHQVAALPDGRPPGRAAAAGALDARGAAGLAVGPAARHGVPGQRGADPEGAQRPVRPDR